MFPCWWTWSIAPVCFSWHCKAQLLQMPLPLRPMLFVLPKLLWILMGRETESRVTYMYSNSTCRGTSILHDGWCDFQRLEHIVCPMCSTASSISCHFFVCFFWRGLFDYIGTCRWVAALENYIGFGKSTEDTLHQHERIYEFGKGDTYSMSNRPEKREANIKSMTNDRKICSCLQRGNWFLWRTNLRNPFHL